MELTGKHILVTGGCGYIGSHTVVELVQAGARVTIVDNLSNSNEKVIHRINAITRLIDEITFVHMDLRDADATEKVIANGQFDAVVHFAALKAVGESVHIPIAYYENNLMGTINLLKALDKHGPKRFLFSSSATVYADVKEAPFLETSKIGSQHPYGRTKCMIEDILQDIVSGDTGPEWKIVILRYFNPIGAHPSGLIGEDPNGIPNNLLPFVAQVAIGKLHCVEVFGNDYDTPDGTGLRDYIHIIDLAQGHLAALTNALFGKMPSNCEAYNIGTGKGSTVLEVIHSFSNACGQKLPYKITSRRQGDVSILVANPTKANEQLKWKAKYTLDDACISTWNWQLKNPQGMETELPELQWHQT